MSKWSLPQPARESSSLPSGQSLSPSQSQRLGTQAYDPGQLNSPGAHVTEPEKKTGPHTVLSKAQEYTSRCILFCSDDTFCYQ